MAAEASRSSGSADSYVGSLISLTSKSEIRYEGILFNINTEEASIGLRNVRSFGTEGRRKDGQQVPPSDKIYEYIVFRGSDIKDLQVKSSPTVQTAPVYNDPAIIQSHYAAPPAPAPSSLPSASTSISATAGSISDSSTQISQPGVTRSTYQSTTPLYQPGGGLPSWSLLTPPTANSSGLSVPMYWQGYYGPSGGLPTQQHSLLQPPQGLSVPPSKQAPLAQQPVQYPTMNSSLPTGAPSVSSSEPMEFPPPLLQPIVSSTGSMLSTVLPAQSYVLAGDSSMNVMPSTTSAQVVPTVSQSTSSYLASPSFAIVLDKTSVAKPVSSLPMPFSSLSEPLSAVAGTSTSPALVTPGQFLPPGPTLCQTSETAQKDVDVVQASPLVSSPQPSPAVAPATTVPVSTEAQAPLLPLPSPSNPKLNGVSSHTHYVNRGGRERGRGNAFSRPVANFTEDFDFEAMNERFNKDEVWGHLGKNKAKANDDLDLQDEDDVNVPEIDSKPVYKKDDFFDTLSCNALDHESRNGRTRFSEQRRLDTETFGEFARSRGFRGGRGPGRGGRGRGGYYGRGYGYVGRGRGHNMYRPI